MNTISKAIGLTFFTLCLVINFQVQAQSEANHADVHSDTVAPPEENLTYDQVVALRRSQDPRSFKFITLSNGLKVALVQDKNTQKAYAAMNVGVGSLADPKDQRGLAHFLEHLLFLGSTKYPDSDDYKKYLSTNGGGSNAFTTREDTNYYFSISAESFEGALDRLAQFFISPLLDPSFVEREKNAVEKEYMRIVENDGWRQFRSNMLLMNPAHPHSWYFPGSLESLKNVTREDAIEFYERYYSASNMNLAIIGPQDLRTLESWAKTYFSDIKNTGAKPFEIPDNVFLANQLPKKIKVKSFSDFNQLSVSFILPYDQDIKTKSLQLISSIMGSEVEGSLKSYLVDKGYVFTLFTGGGAAENYNRFSVTVRLTQLGAANQDEIIVAIFDYINLLKNQGIPAARLQREQAVAEKTFLESSFESSTDLATDLTTGMKKFPGEDYIARLALIETVDIQKINQLLNMLTVENMIVSEMNPSISGPNFDQDYQLPYVVEDLKNSQLVLKLQQERVIPAQMTVPNQNPYFDSLNPMLTNLNESELQPVITKESFRSYVMYDSEFGVSQSRIYINFSESLIGGDKRKAAVRNLAARALAKYINEISFAGTEAGFETKLDPTKLGFQLSITGPSNRMSLFLKDVLEKIKQPMANEIFVILAKEELNEEAAAYITRDPVDAAFEVLTSNAYKDLSLDEYNPFISAITLAEVNQEISKVLSHSFVEVSLLGNLNEALTEEITNTVQSHVITKSSLTAKAQEPQLEFPTNTSGQLQIVKEIVRSQNYGYFYWLKLENLSRAETGASQLLSQIISQQYFDYMRTNKGLAYAVGGNTWNLQDSSLMYLYIQSDADIERLVNETFTWMPTLISNLRKITAEDLETMRKGLLSTLQNPLQNHTQKWDQAFREWNRKYPELIKAERISAIKEASLKDVQSLVDKIEATYPTESVSVGVWPEGADVKLPANHELVDKRLNSFD